MLSQAKDQHRMWMQHMSHHRFKRGSRVSMLLTAGIALIVMRGIVDIVFFDTLHAKSLDHSPPRSFMFDRHNLPSSGTHQRLLATVHSTKEDRWEQNGGLTLSHLKGINSKQRGTINASDQGIPLFSESNPKNTSQQGNNTNAAAAKSPAVAAAPMAARQPMIIPVPKVCQEMTFEVGVEYVGNELLATARDGFEANATACCMRCEALEDCTHWTWSSDSQCSIRHGKLQRYKNTAREASIVSGRVSLNAYTERVHNFQYVKTGDQRRIQQLMMTMENAARSNPSSECKYNPEDARFLPSKENRPASYIVVNEARSGSSWLQEISQMHPGIMVQFELDLAKGDAALMCQECSRPKVPVSKNVSRLPPKAHPPQACGMTLFGSSNRFHEVAALADRHNASIILLLRRNHVAHAISNHRHFTKPVPPDGMVPWDAGELARNVEGSLESYDRLVDFAGRSGRPVHLVFYEDMKRHPREVWAALQAFIGVAVVEVEGMEGLEKKSSNRPSVEYLRDLPGLRRQHAGADWARMLINPHYDEEEFDAATAFAAACRRYPAARMSWRGASCPPPSADPLASKVS